MLPEIIHIINLTSHVVQVNETSTYEDDFRSPQSFYNISVEDMNIISISAGLLAINILFF